MKTKKDSRNQSILKFIGPLACALMLFNLNSAYAKSSTFYASSTVKFNTSASIDTSILHQDLGENQVLQDDQEDVYSLILWSPLRKCFARQSIKIKQQKLLSVSRSVLFRICDLPPPMQLKLVFSLF